MGEKGKSKYNVKVREVYKYWKILEINIETLEGKNKDRKAYSNALCLCTKCNKHTKVISYSRLNNSKECFMCLECSGSKQKTTEKYIEQLKIKVPTAKLKDGQIYKNTKTNLTHICYMCGEDYDASPDAVLGRKQDKCRKCSYIENGKNRTKTTEEYIIELSKINPFVKLKNGEEYINSDIKIKHICSQCKKDWNVAPSQVLSGSCMCQKCGRSLSESIHATIIKQVYQYHYKDSILEEKIYVGGHTYEIDIVNHRRKEAIEIDGSQHNKLHLFHKLASEKHNTTPEYEFEQQKLRDKNIDKYFEDLGYTMIRIDIRKKQPLTALQELFPQYKYLPSWVDFSLKNNCSWDTDKAQALLNEGVHLAEISRIFNISQSALNTAMQYGYLILPQNYKNFTKKPTWSLAKAQELLNQNIQMAEVARQLNIYQNALYRAIKNKQLILPEGYKKGVKRSWSLETAQELMNQGKTNSEIAEMLNVSRGAIASAICSKNLTRNNKNKL